ncbi:MAG: nucleotide pyrophosphohydrolase, partial [Vagococcus sp.]|uniref:nucleotide pyrophosphohydrolase n=1 Tax=Vagococcus sp. TaxID=1933889 RepID=UPI002FC7761C
MAVENSMSKINRFREEREWRQFHNEKDLALSISLEASELLEIYQWKSAKEGNQDREHLKEELADILIYSFMMADNLGFDIDDIIAEKLVKNAEKYPVEKCLKKNEERKKSKKQA